MRAKVTWAGGTQLDCENERGQSIDVDWEDGPSPMQIFLQMIGACSIVDVVVGLKNREFGEVWVDLDADRREEYPRSFTKVNMTYHVEGDVPEKLVRRTIEKSHEKYCSVSNSLDENIEIVWDLVLHQK
ncbi:MAG: OsmC family protein [Candidatus Thermoplasmatota archaeon]|nr:OsmC family protein [Candidatus Thermoplasmatota archaeon]